MKLHLPVRRLACIADIEENIQRYIWSAIGIDHRFQICKTSLQISIHFQETQTLYEPSQRS